MSKAAHYQPRFGRGSSGRALKAAGIVSAVLLGLVLAVYIAGCVYFSGKLWPNTSANGVDLSLMSKAQAQEALDARSKNISVAVSGMGLRFSVDADSAGVASNSQAAAIAMANKVNPLSWPISIMASHDMSTIVSTTFDTEAVMAVVRNAVSLYNKTATPPTDASLTYDDASGAFTIDPGSAGTQMDAGLVAQKVVNAFLTGATSVTVTADELLQQAVTADDPTLIAARDAANAYLTCDLDFTLNGTVVATLDASVVKDWVVVGSDGSVSLDDQKLVAFSDQIEDAVDDVGEARTYTRPDGKVVSVTGGSYGWISDGDTIEAMVRDTVANGYTGTQEIPCKQTAAVFNPGGQDWSARYIDIDLSEQHVRLYDETGALIWESDCVTGDTTKGNGTPEGVYFINNKATDVTLIGRTDPVTNQPEYRTPVSYWMPFVNNAVGLHDASWQAAFGGTRYTDGYGSHGCVNLPSDAAATLYGLIQLGDAVVVHS